MDGRRLPHKSDLADAGDRNAVLIMRAHGSLNDAFDLDLLADQVGTVGRAHGIDIPCKYYNPVSFGSFLSDGLKMGVR